MAYLIWITVSYFSGSIPVGYWIGKLKGIDLTQIGSGSTGATNVLRSIGRLAAFTTLIFDILKGFLPVYFSIRFAGNNLIVILTGIACIIGHSKSIFLNFKGGKSSAIGLGILTALSWHVAIITFLIWLIIVFVSRYSSLGSIVAIPLVPFWFYFFHKSRYFILFGVFASVYIVLIRHRGNLQRLLKGTEPKIGEKQ